SNGAARKQLLGASWSSRPCLRQVLLLILELEDSSTAVFVSQKGQNAGENPVAPSHPWSRAAAGQLELDRLVQRAALGAARSIHVGVVGVNESAFVTTKDMILARGRAEALLPSLVIDAD